MFHEAGHFPGDQFRMAPVCLGEGRIDLDGVMHFKYHLDVSFGVFHCPVEAIKEFLPR